MAPNGVNFEVRLIEEVRHHPVLYENMSRSKEALSERSAKWGEVAAKLGVSEEKARTVWKDLRGTFVKQYKADGAASSKYSEQMSFLKTIIDQQASENGEWIATEMVDAGEVEILDAAAEAAENTDEDPAKKSAESASRASKHGENQQLLNVQTPERKRGAEEDKENSDAPGSSKTQKLGCTAGQLTDDEEDDDELFFRMIRRKFKRMDDAAKDRAKAKFFDALNDVNYGQN